MGRRSYGFSYSGNAACQSSYGFIQRAARRITFDREACIDLIRKAGARDSYGGVSVLDLDAKYRKRSAVNSIYFDCCKFFGIFRRFPGCSATENIQECCHARQFSCNIRGIVKVRKLSSRRIGNIFATTGDCRDFPE